MIRRLVLLVFPTLCLSGCKAIESMTQGLASSGISPMESNFGADTIEALAKNYGGPVDDPQLATYVRDLGFELVPHVGKEYENGEWQFLLVKESAPFACAAPGGKIVVSQGLARRLKSRAELAAVLGHEMAHVVRQHAWGEIKQKVAIELGKRIVEASSPKTRERIQEIGGESLMDQTGFRISFTANQEHEADDLGVELLQVSSYPPEAMLRLLETLDTIVPTASGPDILATHPTTPERLERVRAKVDGLPTLGEYKGTNEADFSSQFLAPLLSMKLAARDSVLSPTTWCQNCETRWRTVPTAPKPSPGVSSFARSPAPPVASH